MGAPKKIYIPRLEGNETFVHEWDTTKFRKYFGREIAENAEYVRTDVVVKDVKQFLAEIHRVCDITDENGYRIELRDLQARFENFYKETKI